MKAAELVAIEADNELTVHLPGAVGDYATLCGLDGDDPDAGVTVKRPRGVKVNCPTCLAIWTLCRAAPPALLDRDVLRDMGSE